MQGCGIPNQHLLYVVGSLKRDNLAKTKWNSSSGHELQQEILKRRKNEKKKVMCFNSFSQCSPLKASKQKGVNRCAVC